jgi:hypothetical protein
VLNVLVGAILFGAAGYSPAGEFRETAPWVIFSIVWVLLWVAIAFAVRGAPSVKG